MLKKYIQYFLFFKKTDSAFTTYTTFPNNNLCLTIYKDNSISYSKKDDNKFLIGNNSNNQPITSKLLGFHQTPFQVEISAELDQICLIFQPAALKVFTNESFGNLMDSDSVFDDIFGDKQSDLERIFDLSDLNDRTTELEKILLENLKNSVSCKLEEALFLVHQKNIHSIEILSKQLEISDVTLFRLFKNQLGQNPKSYLKTIRFRRSLNDILTINHSLTDIAYQNQYFDQSHFIKDFKTFTGICPKVIPDKISVRQDQFLWMYNGR